MKSDLLSYYSDQLTNVVAQPPVMNPPYEDGGKVRIKEFTYTVPAGGIAATSVIGLAIVPADCKIVGGQMKFAALSGTSGTVDVGIAGADGSGYYTGTTADDDDFFLSAVDTTATAGDTFATTSANDGNSQYETTKEVVITLTVNTAALTSGKVLTGLVEYVQN